MVTLRYFDLFIMIVICASSIALAAEDPVQVKKIIRANLKFALIIFVRSIAYNSLGQF